MEIKKAMEEVSFKYRGKKLRFKAKKVGFFGRAIGLMFQKRENAEILLFEFAKSTKTPIHSMLVFFPFFAVWLDGKSRIVDIKVVPPFTISVVPKQEFVKLIEIPLSQKYSSLTEIFPRR